ncbi:hypothetical protein AAC387_Pa01g1214 [Persea americana]
MQCRLGSDQHHKELKAAHGIKITAQGLEHVFPGIGLYVVGPGNDVQVVKEAAVQDPDSIMSRSDKSGQVCKRDVMKATVMLERKREYATILALDVKVMPEAQELADETGV